MAVVAKVQGLIQENPLIVFSKTYCPYCRSVKQLFQSLGVEPKVVEIDKEEDGTEIQKALGEISNQRTVPNVFISGEHVGGSDATKAAHKKGALVPMLKKAGVLKDEEKAGPKDEVAKCEAETAKEAVQGDQTKSGGVPDLLKDVKEDDSKNAAPVKDIVV